MACGLGVVVSPETTPFVRSRRISSYIRKVRLPTAWIRLQYFRIYAVIYIYIYRDQLNLIHLTPFGIVTPEQHSASSYSTLFLVRGLIYGGFHLFFLRIHWNQ